MKKLLFLSIGILGVYLYINRDMFRSTDVIRFGGTADTLLDKTKVYAFISKPDKVEYKNGAWYNGNGEPGILVSDGTEHYGLPKKYGYVVFYVSLGGKFYHNTFDFEKEDRDKAYEIEFSIHQVGASFFLSGDVTHHGRTVHSFSHHPMQPLAEGLEITYYWPKED
jgi:hypothetical protein